MRSLPLFSVLRLEKHIDNAADFSDEYLAQVVGLVKGRINFVNDIWDNAKFFFVAPDSYDPKAVKKRWSQDTPAWLTELLAVLDGVEDFEGAETEPTVMAWIAEKGYHLGNLMNAFRLAVVGECKGPHMFDITRLLGREETKKRVLRAIDQIKCDEPAV